MAAPLRTARLFLLVTFVAGWGGSVLGAPVLLAFSLHGHAHEVRMTETDGHLDAVLHHDGPDEHAGDVHARDAHADAPHVGPPQGGVPVHSDHTVHLPELTAVAVAKAAPTPALIAVLTPVWTLPARVPPPRATPSVPVPDGLLAALRSTVLLV